MATYQNPYLTEEDQVSSRRPAQSAAAQLAQQLVNPAIGEAGGTIGQGIDESGNGQQSSNQNFVTQQANQMAQPAGGNFQPTAPSPVAQFPTYSATPNAYANPTGPYNNAYGLATQLTQKASQGINPKVIAQQKEISKEGYNSQLAQALASIKQSAASRGLGGGWVGSQLAATQAKAPLDITSLYRQVDQNAEQTGLQNLIAALTANQGLGASVAQDEIARTGLANQLALGQGNLALGNRQQSLAEANATYDRNNILPMLLQYLGPAFNWGAQLQ